MGQSLTLNYFETGAVVREYVSSRNGCGTLCETNEWLDMIKGKCVLGSDGVSATCQCPKGFDGIDTWDDHRDCHVNISVRFSLNLIVCLISLASFLYNFYLLCMITDTWGLDVFPDIIRDSVRFLLFKIKAIDSYHSSSTGVGAVVASVPNSPHNVNINANPNNNNNNNNNPNAPGALMSTPTVTKGRSFRTKHQQIRRTNQVTFSMVFFFCIGGIGSFVYTLLMILPTPIYRFHDSIAMRLAFAAAATSLLTSIWGLVLLWYSSLPNLRIYGTLFSMNSILVKDPRLIPRLCYAHIGLVFMISPIILIIIPSFYPQIRALTDSIFLFLSSLLLISWEIFVLIVSFLLRAAYQKSLLALNGLETSPIAKNDINEQRRRSGFKVPERNVFVDAIRRINGIVILCVVGATFVIFMHLAMIFFPFFRMNAHIFYSIIASVANFACILFSVVLVHKPVHTLRVTVKAQQSTNIRQSDLAMRNHTPQINGNNPNLHPPQPIPEVTEPLDINSMAAPASRIG